jgi:hypothetical protein
MHVEIIPVDDIFFFNQETVRQKPHGNLLTPHQHNYKREQELQKGRILVGSSRATLPWRARPPQRWRAGDSAALPVGDKAR